MVSEEEINRILEQESGWIPVDEQIPNTDKYILVSFETLLFQISEDMKLMKMVTVRFIRGMMIKAMQIWIICKCMDATTGAVHGKRGKS